MAKAKEVEGLDCEAEATEGVRRVLRARLGEVYDLRAAALKWEDTEGVHDMRVASRRLRSALRDFADLLGGKGVSQRRLKAVADALGEVRDQDVAIALLEKIRTKGGEEVSAGIEQLIRERDAVRARARERLREAIAETPLAEMREKLLAQLEKAGGPSSARDARKRGGRARRAVSFREAGREVVKQRVTELRGLSDSLHHPFEIEPLHDMRIAAKRLRYALELFAACWGSGLSSCARELSELQGALGDLRDCDVWIADLGAMLDRQRGRKAGESAESAAQARRAAIWLLRHFTKERGKHFRRALARWHKWETGGFFERLSALLGDTPPSPAGKVLLRETGRGAPTDGPAPEGRAAEGEEASASDSRGRAGVTA